MTNDDKHKPDLLPCPFCGEKLVELSDHHGSWWGHKNFNGCILDVEQIHDAKDAAQWNTRAEQPSQQQTMGDDAQTIEDYRAWARDIDRLVRELDVALNGVEGAAKQASLCDIIAQVKHEAALSAQSNTDVGKIRETLEFYAKCISKEKNKHYLSGTMTPGTFPVFDDGKMARATLRELDLIAASPSKAGE